MNREYYSRSHTYEELNGIPQKDIQRVNDNGHIQVKGNIRGVPFSYDNRNKRKKNQIQPFSRKFRQPTPYPRKKNNKTSSRRNQNISRRNTKRKRS